MPMLTEAAEAAEATRPSPVVDSLAAVFGGDAVRIFKDLASWTTGTKVYIALRLCRTIASRAGLAEVMNSALASQPQLPQLPQLPSLRSLAAVRFLEFAVASIREEVDPKSAAASHMQVAGTILRELAPLSGPGIEALGASNERTAPRPRPVDSTLPKGFPGTCGPGNHAINYTPMLLLEIRRGDDTRLASIVSNEIHGSGSISMFTAAQEIRRLLLCGARSPRTQRCSFPLRSTTSHTKERTARS
jgi:hypothetical protein